MRYIKIKTESEEQKKANKTGKVEIWLLRVIIELMINAPVVYGLDQITRNQIMPFPNINTHDIKHFCYLDREGLVSDNPQKILSDYARFSTGFQIGVDITAWLVLSFLGPLRKHPLFSFGSRTFSPILWWMVLTFLGPNDNTIEEVTTSIFFTCSKLNTTAICDRNTVSYLPYTKAANECIEDHFIASFISPILYLVMIVTAISIFTSLGSYKIQQGIHRIFKPSNKTNEIEMQTILIEESEGEENKKIELS